MMLQAAVSELLSWPNCLPVLIFCVLVSALLVWALWLNWQSRRR